MLVIPAYRPSQVLLDMLERLYCVWRSPVILVNDGSENTYDHIFKKAESMGCIVKRHAKNLGKGRALKTAFEECFKKFPDFIGVVTADADGQHDPDDIVACGDALVKNPDKLVLGCRTFEMGEMPMHNFFGNKVFAMSMRILFGIKVNDAQTGLRGIPMSFMEQLMDVPGERYELESNMLVEAQRGGYEFEEVPIKTIYREKTDPAYDDNRSHFNVVKDSLKIYLQLFRYALSSMASTAVDLALFALLVTIFDNVGVASSIAVATVLARCVAGVVNFSINRNAVFKSKAPLFGDAARYTLLFFAVMATSAALVTAISDGFNIPSVPVKMCVDFLLFFVNYRIQRSWVFKDRTPRAAS